MALKALRTIREIVGLRRSDRRAVVFLEGDGCSAGRGFDSLVEKKNREVRDRMDHWIGGGHKPTYHHPWNDHPYTACYCFKWKENRVHQRLYGFLCHPDGDLPNFEVCVLVTHDQKTEEDTDFRILDAINRIRVEKNVEEAIKTWLKERRKAQR